MAFTFPYRQHNYMGEHASDADATSFVQANHWDTAGDGSGNPQAGMWYYNTAQKEFRFHNGTAWKPFGGGSGGNDTDFQESVKSFYDNSGGLPASPSAGDRYIAQHTANGWNQNSIYEYNGSTWDETVPTEGTTCEVEDQDKFYTFNGSSWVPMPSYFNHSELQNLKGGSAPDDYYHITQAQHSGLTGGNDAGTLHHHDTRYYTETELGSTTSGSEGAALIGTDSKGSLNNATNVEAALTELNDRNPPRRLGGSGNPNGNETGIAGDIYTDISNGIVYQNIGATSNNNQWVVV